MALFTIYLLLLSIYFILFYFFVVFSKCFGFGLVADVCGEGEGEGGKRRGESGVKVGVKGVG